MPGISIHVSIGGLKELAGRMLNWSRTEKHRMYAQAMKDSLEAIGDAVPPYPAPPMGSKYIRTEKLGKSMGSGFGGGRMGQPDIYEIRATGGAVEGKYGSNLGYAEYVIGDPPDQAEVHAGRWWTVGKLRDRAMDKISGIWNALGERIAAYINGR